MRSNTFPNGFTLIELLIVIAILAVLTAAVVLVINPVELLRQSRDTTRLSDIAALNSAISLYINDTSGALWVATSTCTAVGAILPTSSLACAITTSTANDGTGWVPLNFTLVSARAPIGKLPMDPINSSSSSGTVCAGSPTGCYYAFHSTTSNGARYKIFAKMESLKYASTTARDGGTNVDWYEVGNDIAGL